MINSFDLLEQGLEEAITALKQLPSPFSSNLLSTTGGTFSQGFNYESSSKAMGSHRVEQGGVGFSADEPIGTEHVGNCVAVIARNSRTGKVGLAHYDAVTTPESLQRLFDRLSDGHIDVVIIGAMYDMATVGNDYLRDTSASNLTDVLQFLSKKDTNILGAQIHDPKQPTNFVVNPKDFSFSSASPNIPNPDKDLAFAGKFLTGKKQPLAIEFDLTQSKQRFPYLLDHEQVYNLNHHVKGKNRGQIATWHKSLGAHGGFEEIQANLSLGTYLPNYEKEVGAIMKKLGSSTTEQTIRSQPMYIGENATATNCRIFRPLDQNVPSNSIF